MTVDSPIKVLEASDQWSPGQVIDHLIVKSLHNCY